MCNLYSQTKPLDAIRDLFELDAQPATNAPPLPAIFPGHDAPVVLLDGGARVLRTMSWGFVLPQRSKKTGKEIAPRRVTNARDDKVLSSRFWRESLDARRRLAPASSFCEPSGAPAVWTWFALTGDEPRPLFTFAGLWRRWRGKLKGEDVDLETYAILTTTPNEPIGPVRQDRMPVILDPADYEAWLEGPTDEAFALAKPFPAERMRIVKSGAEKEDGEQS